MSTTPLTKQQVTIEVLAPGCAAAELICSSSEGQWNTVTGVVRLLPRSPGLYVGVAPWLGRPVTYKYHVGSWESEELDAWGNRRPNRYYDGMGDIRDVCQGFLSQGAYHRAAYLPHIEPLPSNLPLPKPFETRRIAALLPADYERSSRRYPVLYLQDGQNLFDEYSPHGNWELDKRMAWLAERGLGDFIVVAIDHAAEKRQKEYAPPHQTRIARGQADAYGRFVVNHLKPLIDRTYRTDPSRDSSAIGGSSLGALAALQVAMNHSAVFGRAMLLSPSIWVDPELPMRWPEHGFGPTTVFVYGGMIESPGSTATFASLCVSLAEVDQPKRRIYLRTHFEPNAEHNERAWGAVFPRAACALFA